MLAFDIVDQFRSLWTSGNVVEFNIENERLSGGVDVVVKTLSLEISRCRLRRLCQRILIKWVPHVQHDYFSSFNQSEHCFLALSLPFRSSLAKTPSLTVESGSLEPVNIFRRI